MTYIESLNSRLHLFLRIIMLLSHQVSTDRYR